MEEFSRPTQPDWYKDAVIYQVHVRTFFDGNDDGIGDFVGLVRKLDYLQALGINTIWILPFYPSPLRDDGYDIAHYQGVHPAYGTLRDVRRFLREAHARGLRVITELVMNHTSDQHPWFQAARHAPPGSPARDFYVWSDTNRKYEDTRVIFTDTETSNWTWDPAAGAFYWHRFFHHQPDLNFENPRVIRAMLRAMRFWLDLGVDAFRLDAIPYLIEREGTSCESLPETHAIIRQVRKFMDAEYPGRVLLAEANQWPSDVSAYFGSGDECHMAFHFPLMPRLYMGIEREDREPIVEILRQTPDIPASCQWALFLRNHDELTLEMVTPEEREYMYGAFAEDPRMRINVGIRRRLAPLLDGDRRRVELLTVLLLSLPGTPVVYYGDEIGMGDNIYLSDRHGVRTPMQWTGDRNGGFSRADPQRLCAPPVMDPVFGFQAVNVEAQERSPASLLNWTRRMIAMRQAHPTFGRGAIEFVETGNRKVLAFLRTHQDDTVLVVANLSAHVQAAQVQTRHDRVHVEMLGSTRMPPLERGGLGLTLAPYGWYWLHVLDANDPRVQGEAVADQRRHAMPDLLVSERWDTLFDGPGRAILERRYLRPYLERQSWYRAPGASVRSVRIASHALARGGADPIVLAAVDVESDVDTYRYGLVLTFTSGLRGEEILERHPDRVLARIAGARRGTLHEVIEADAARVLMRMLTDGTRLAGRDGIFDAASQGPAVLADHEPYTLMPTTLGQTVITCGAAAELKIRRRLLPGRSHEQLLLGALAHNLDVELPMAYANLDLLTPDNRRWPFVLLRSQVPFTDDGWDRSRQLAQRWIAEPRTMADRPDPFAWLREGRDAPRLDSEPLHEVEAMARVMGRRVAATHMAIVATGAANAAQDAAGSDTFPSKDRELADAALAALSDLPDQVRSRWATLIDSPAGRRILASRQVLGALARWRWSDGEPAPVDPDDSTPGTRGTSDYGERDIAALAADLAYAALTALQQAGHRDPQDPAARAWWSIATWALVRGWQEELAAAGTSTGSVSDLIEGLRVGLLWRLLVDAVSAGEDRRHQAQAVLQDLAARPVGDR
ncbi:Trehalose synthase/amylase TreS [Luteitalea pratensis]|uniref:maltose alpha-D-glucosyltransferase n=1 Tax=Luteitalea pratensis TaxID=1855912 RepID=A0A143PI14_LUTPR|nr:maltose alpha-D-glucosyltransferase [Luteitalea pratensis]AMY07404.1 Trehalose synthase/amylase TreS [Luteitalea pratensis]